MKFGNSKRKCVYQNTKEEYPIVKSLPNAKFDKKIKAWVVPGNS